MEEQDLQATLETLRAEHRELDQTILDLELESSRDELLVRRLKKRKLLLRDRIAAVERVLEPDDIA